MSVLGRESFAEEEVLFVSADGRRTYGSIRIGVPRWIEYDVAARCSVALVGLEKPYEISGATTLQALLLAIRFCVSRIRAFLDGGGKILFPDGETAWDPEPIFGALMTG